MIGKSYKNIFNLNFFYILLINLTFKLKLLTFKRLYIIFFIVNIEYYQCHNCLIRLYRLLEQKKIKK